MAEVKYTADNELEVDLLLQEVQGIAPGQSLYFMKGNDLLRRCGL